MNVLEKWAAIILELCIAVAVLEISEAVCNWLTEDEEEEDEDPATVFGHSNRTVMSGGSGGGMAR